MQKAPFRLDNGNSVQYIAQPKHGKFLQCTEAKYFLDFNGQVIYSGLNVVREIKFEIIFLIASTDLQRLL